MIIVETVVALQAQIEEAKQQGKKVGFVPTMGALHAGHLSLVAEAQRSCACVVVSVFVNPTQFNNPDDLLHYPRTISNDCELLETQNVDVVFVPSVEEVYPQEDTRQFDFGTLDKVMEGEHRPGHFNGVAQVVSRLFDMVMPDRAFFGEKDFQQLAIIKAMVAQLKLNIEIVPCPIVRENDGLAMSSRNERLSAECRSAAPLISQVLLDSKGMGQNLSISESKQLVIDAIAVHPLLELEYFDIVDTLTLERSSSWDDEGEKVGCIAVFAGNVRLIDNIIY